MGFHASFPVTGTHPLTTPESEIERRQCWLSIHLKKCMDLLCIEVQSDLLPVIEFQFSFPVKYYINECLTFLVPITVF